VASVPPDAPFATATVNPDTTVTLNWVDGTPVSYASLAAWGNPGNEVGYRIERGVADAGGTVATWGAIGTALANGTTYTDATGVPSTTYKYRVVAWNAAGETVATTASATLPAPTPATGLTVTASASSPYYTGESVTFTATGSGSTTDGIPTPASGYQYRFQLWNGTAYSVVQGYSANNVWTMTANPVPGNYRIYVEVRTSGAVVFDTVARVYFTVVVPFPTPATALSVTTNAASPYDLGQQVTFTATGSGSTTGGLPTPASVYQYRFQLWNGTAYTVVQGYSASNTYTMTANSVPGNYRIYVDVRTKSTVTTDTFARVYFSVVAPAPTPATSLTVTANATSPFNTGQQVTFTATGSGSTTGGLPTPASGYQYRFQLWNGTAYTVVQGFSANNTYTMTANSVPGNYRIYVEVRTTNTVVFDTVQRFYFTVQ